MNHDRPLTKVENQYESAHAAQYTTKDLPLALGLYKALVVAHPDSPEAGYSRTQISNIVKFVVPREALMEVEVELALAHLRQEKNVTRALQHLKRETAEDPS